MLHHLFYFGVLLPTIVIVVFFIVFLICWFRCRLRERFLHSHNKFKGGSHNSTHTSLASATSNGPPGRDYWEHHKMYRSDTQQTSLCTSSKYVPGEFPAPDDDWRYMSRNSIDKERNVWTTKWTSDSSVDSHCPQERDSGIGRHDSRARGRTNYALLEDECVVSAQIEPRCAVHYTSSESHDDLSPLSDDTVDFRDRPPRPDDDRHTSQLTFVCGSYRTNLNGYSHLVPNVDDLPYDRHALKLDAIDLASMNGFTHMNGNVRNGFTKTDRGNMASTSLDSRADFNTSNRRSTMPVPFSSGYIMKKGQGPSTKSNGTHSAARNGYLTENNMASEFEDSNAAAVNGHVAAAPDTPGSPGRYQCSPYAVAEIRTPVISV